MRFYKDKNCLPTPHHVCIVVKDLDKAMDLVHSIFGTKTWNIEVYSHSKDEVLVGEAFSLRYAQCELGETGMILELMQPIIKGGVWSHFLDKHGEGLHHICFTTPDYDEDVAKLSKQGSEIVAGGLYKGIRWCYFDAEPTGMVLELIDEKQLMKQKNK